MPVCFAERDGNKKKIVVKGDLKSKVAFYHSRQAVSKVTFYLSKQMAPLNISSAGKVLNTIFKYLLLMCSALFKK